MILSYEGEQKCIAINKNNMSGIAKDESGRRYREKARGWSEWVKILNHKEEASATYELRPEHRGRYHKGNLNSLYDKGCCIYEWCVTKDGRQHVVYIGKTCRQSDDDDGMNSLRSRIGEYARHGSHIHEQIDEALAYGCNLKVRYLKCYSANGVDKMEEAHLATYNYAWNKQNNKPQRLELLQELN